jgi:hypothetical protein
MFLHREVVTAEATRRQHQAKVRNLVDIKPVTLDALDLHKVKEKKKPTETEVAPIIEWVKSKLQRDPIEKVLAAAEKDWTTIVMPADDFDFVGTKDALHGPLQTSDGFFFEWEERCLRLYSRVLGHKVLQDQHVAPDLRPLLTWMHDEVIVRHKGTHPPPPPPL